MLLYGEYTVMYNSPALAIPLSNFFGQWEEQSDTIDRRLLDYANWMSTHEVERFVDVEAFFKALRDGLIFKSNIPQGSGLGSSGALVAAIYDGFSKSKKNSISYGDVKDQLAELESYFHGKSSGLDPLVSFYNQPMIIQDGETSPIDNTFQEATSRFFLIDSGIPRKTAPLVQRFNTLLAQPEFEKMVLEEWVPLIHRCISKHIDNDLQALEEDLHALSSLMLRYMKDFIPPGHLELWERSLTDHQYSLKLCGAGGGGMTLGFGDPGELPHLEL